jgi:hypothetical protein
MATDNRDYTRYWAGINMLIRLFQWKTGTFSWAENTADVIVRRNIAVFSASCDPV